MSPTSKKVCKDTHFYRLLPAGQFGNQHPMKCSQKHLMSYLMSRRSAVCGFGSPIILLLNGVLVIFIIAPIFIPKVPRQPNVKDITVVIPPHSIDSMVTSLKESGFRKIHAISYDDPAPDDSRNSIFSSFRQAHGSFGDDVSSISNTSFILFGGSDVFKVPMNLPSLPNRVMVIGYSFAECHEGGFALLMPTQLEYSMITMEAMQRFTDFSSGVLKGLMSASEAFRTFCDFHSLHLLIMPCGSCSPVLPKWETIEVVEYENANPPVPWGHIEKIEEIWKIKNIM